MGTLIGQGKTFDSFLGKSNLDILEYLDPTPAFEERIRYGRDGEVENNILFKWVILVFSRKHCFDGSV